MWRNVASFFVWLAAALALVPLPAAAQSTGTLVITDSTRLGQDHVGSIVIAADNITLDCAGRKVTPATGSTGFTIGIDLRFRSGVTVKNCKVSGFSNGFFLFYTHGNTLLDNEANGNRIGFNWSEGSRYEYVERNRAYGNEVGFSLLINTGFTLLSNEAKGNTYGFLLAMANANTLEMNSATGNSTGFLHFFSNGNTLRRNEARGNSIGIDLQSSNNNTFIVNVACSNRAVDTRQDVSSTNNILVDNNFCTPQVKEM